MTIGILLFLNLGTEEVILIVFVALLLFGGKKMPELAKGLGKGIREFRDASDSVKREIHKNINQLTAEEELKKEEELIEVERIKIANNRNSQNLISKDEAVDQINNSQI